MRVRFIPSREEFVSLAAGNPGHPLRIPVALEMLADLETPVTLYFKLRSLLGPGAPRRRATFLLESASPHAEVGRYSFLGVSERLLTVQGKRITCYRSSEGERITELPQPWDTLRNELFSYPVAAVPGLPPFAGGAVGYLGYDAVRYIERLPELARLDLPLPEVLLAFTDVVFAFDHFRRTLFAMAVPVVDPNEIPSRLEGTYDEVTGRLHSLVERVLSTTPAASPSFSPLPNQSGMASNGSGSPGIQSGLVGAAGPEGGPPSGMAWRSTFSEEEFCRAVTLARHYIEAGDIFQVVLSQRLELLGPAPDSLEFYRALRMTNPSPYLFHLDFGDLAVVGSSPEVMVRLRGRRAEVRPIAGTRPRGRNPEEDRRLQAELLADPKERAEHVMLVDLGRNDLGRVCRYGSVHVPEQMVIEEYSHVSHLVSLVRGELAAGRDAIDLLQATFPAGTVSGAPKVRAMEIIEALEPVRRGVYAGAVGYIGYDGNLDTCITIRTGLFREGRLYVQAGAGIVADSIPEREYQETLHKAAALLETAKEVLAGATARH